VHRGCESGAVRRPSGNALFGGLQSERRRLLAVRKCAARTFLQTLGSTFTAPTNVQFMGGGQVGINYQFWGGVVIGAEAMFDWLPPTQTASITATAPDGTGAFFGAINNRWLTTAAAGWNLWNRASGIPAESARLRTRSKC